MGHERRPVRALPDRRAPRLALAGLLVGVERRFEERADGLRPVERAGLAPMELQAVTESPTVAYIQALIAFTHQWLNDAYQQDAGPNGSAAAPFDRSTQPN